MVEDTSSLYGLGLEEGERFQFLNASDFDHRNNGKKFLRINLDYSIDFDPKNRSEGRTLYTRQNGLSGLSLNRDLDLNSNWNNLANSKSIKKIARIYGLNSSILYTYFLKGMKDSKKVMFIYAIKGRKGEKGFISQLDGRWVANTCFMIPIEKDSEMIDLFDTWEVKYNRKNIFLMD